jgi:hypothetical protein
MGFPVAKEPGVTRPEIEKAVLPRRGRARRGRVVRSIFWRGMTLGAQIIRPPILDKLFDGFALGQLVIQHFSHQFL